MKILGKTCYLINLLSSIIQFNVEQTFYHLIFYLIISTYFKVPTTNLLVFFLIEYY